MRYLTLTLLLLLSHLTADAQLKTEWVKTMGDVNTEHIYDMALDSEGNMVVLGMIDDYFGGVACDLDVGPGNTALESSPDGWHNILLAKFDSLGNHIWSFALWDEGLDPQPNKLDLDADDNIYITGELRQAIDIDPGPDTLLLDHNEGEFRTLFAIKYSPDGDLIWGDTYGGTSNCTGHQILVEGDEVFLSGGMSNTTYTGFNDSTIIENLWSDYNNGFVAKYDTDMNHVWSIPVAAGNGTNNQVTCIALGQEGQIFTAGTFDRTADFDPNDTVDFILNSPLPNDQYSADMFIASYDVDGALIHAISVGSDVAFERFSEVFDLKVDLNGDILVTGWYSGLIDFDPGADITNLNGDNDIFLAKYSSDLELIWTFSIAGTYYDIGKEIEIDANNDIYLHGQYYWNGDFDPGPDEFIISGSNGRGFIAKYNEDGNFITANDIGASSSFGYEMHGMEIGQNGSLYLAGYFYGEEDFDLDEDDELLFTDLGSGDLFLGKFHYYDPVAPYIQSVNPSQIASNGAVTLHIEGFDMEEVLDITLLSATDTIHHESFSPLSEFELDVLFGLDNEAAGFRDLHVQLEDTLLILVDGIEILPPLADQPNGSMKFLSAERMLLNRPEPSIGLAKNTGPTDMIAVPVVYRGIYEGLEFENLMPTVDLTSDPAFVPLIEELALLGIAEDELNNIHISAPEGGMLSMLLPHIPSQSEKTIFMRATALDLEPSSFAMILNVNGLLDSEALLPEYTPEPSFCIQEMFIYTITESAPGLDGTTMESCFSSSYAEMQNVLLALTQAPENQNKVIPLKGLMMKVGYDMIECMDPTYDITAQVLDSVVVNMSRLLGAPFILDSEFDCSEYINFAEGLKSALADESQYDVEVPLNNDKGSPGGISAQCQAMGISFGYGCSSFPTPCPDPQASMDPNEKYGPFNVYSGTDHISYSSELSYTIHFENADSATVAAKEVLIIDSLDTSVFDLTSVKFNYAHWGDTIVSISEGATFVDLRPEHPNILKITAHVDTLSGVLSCDFETLDTLTMLLTLDIDQGFLPPNVNSPEGMGSIIFTIDLLQDLPSPTAFENDALIYFDFNEPIYTPAWQNTFDNVSTNSHVTDNFEVLSDESFTVHWESDDADDPALYYAILVSVNSPDDWEIWQEFTTETSADYFGELGSTYHFLSIAADSAMNLEAIPTVADAVFLFAVDGLTELDETSFRLYPNPAEDQVTLRFAQSDVEGIEIVDVNGRVIHAELTNGLSSHLIELRSIPEGIYLIRARSAQGVLTRRLVIQR